MDSEFWTVGGYVTRFNSVPYRLNDQGIKKCWDCVLRVLKGNEMLGKWAWILKSGTSDGIYGALGIVNGHYEILHPFCCDG